MHIVVEKVVSGGQTGVDRAALDAALELGIATGGWVPKGRRSEEGPIPDSYSTLEETGSTSYAERTELNVRDSDATVIITRGELAGGSKLTEDFAHRYGKPCIHLGVDMETAGSAFRELRDWLVSNNVETLNVAGPRASSDPSIYELAKDILTRALLSNRNVDAPAAR